MNTRTSTIVNGVDVGRLVETVNAIEQSPDLARFQFRAHSEWIDGGHSQTTIQGFSAGGQEDSSRHTPFVVDGDEPDVLLGTNTAPNAVEAVLHALASCLAVGFIYNAAARGIEVKGMDFDLEGDLDLRAFLGLSEDVRPGYDRVRLTYRVQSDASREQIVELCNYVQKTSPVLDMLRNPVPVSISLDA